MSWISLINGFQETHEKRSDEFEIPDVDTILAGDIKDPRKSWRLNDDEFIAGKLSDFSANWAIVAEGDSRSEKFLHIIRNGLDIFEFLKSDQVLSDAPMQNSKSARNNADFVRETLAKWVDQRVVEIVDYYSDTLINGLIVAMDNGKPSRLCLHTLHVNNALRDCPFSLPTVYDLAIMTEPGYGVTTVDIKSGFLHIPLQSKSKRLLGMQFPDEHGNIITHRSRVMMWGMKIASYIFQEIQAIPVRFLQRKGAQITLMTQV